MKSTQGSQIKHNAAWRAFWIKIRELNACETDRREEIGDQDNDASAVATNEGDGLRMTTDEMGHR